MRSIAFALVVLGAAVASAATPIPPFPADHVAVAGVTDTFAPLRSFLAEFRSDVGAKYDVCIVAHSDPQDRSGKQFADSAVPYVDRVFEAWRDALSAHRYEDAARAAEPPVTIERLRTGSNRSGSSSSSPSWSSSSSSSSSRASSSGGGSSYGSSSGGSSFSSSSGGSSW